MTPDVSAMLILILTSSINLGGAPEVSWTVPTTNNDGSLIVTPLTYNLYRSHDGRSYQKVRDSVKATGITIIGDLIVGARECFKVGVIEEGVEAITVPDCITLHGTK